MNCYICESLMKTNFTYNCVRYELAVELSNRATHTDL